ncbi:hypothetical protein HD806DRAFT_499530 [Xylariaceae sp. AK1471]|nr:hypothetical protein HD806DRAFT_499530 [Xylariaceae sp. AK1471]
MERHAGSNHALMNQEQEFIIKLLLDKGGNIKLQDNYNWTPLSLPARDEQEEVVQLLVENRANTESKDHAGRTPLS